MFVDGLAAGRRTQNYAYIMQCNSSPINTLVGDKHIRPDKADATDTITHQTSNHYFESSLPIPVRQRLKTQGIKQKAWEVGRGHEATHLPNLFQREHRL